MVSTLVLAERVCGAPDRLDPPGMPRPYCCDRRATPAPHPHVLLIEKRYRRDVEQRGRGRFSDSDLVYWLARRSRTTIQIKVAIISVPPRADASPQ